MLSRWLSNFFFFAFGFTCSYAQFKTTNRSKRTDNYTIQVFLPVSPLETPLIKGGLLFNGSQWTLFKLGPIKGPTDNDRSSSYERPRDCNSPENYIPPQNYYCINTTSGNLYATGWINQRPPRLNSDFLIEILGLSSTTENVYKFAVKFKATCKLVNQTWTKFKNVGSKCSSINSSVGSSSNGKSVVFIITGQMKSLIGFTINSSVFKNTTQKFSLNVKTSKKTFGFNYDRNKTSNEEKVQARLNFDYFVNENITVIVYEFENNGYKEVVINSKSIQLVYISSWNMCRYNDCLQAYKTWNETNANVYPKQCNLQDSQFASSHEKCFDLKPIVKKPELNKDYNLMCSYHGSTDNLLGHSYVLFNGTTHLRSILTPQRKKRRRKRDLSTILSEFPPWQYKINNYNISRGFFQCAIFDKERMVQPRLSEKTWVYIKEPFFKTFDTKTITVKAGTKFLYIACEFISRLSVPFTREDIFWLKNDKQMIFPTTNPQLKGSKSQEHTYGFPNVTVQKSELVHTGTYQCGILKKSQMKNPVLSTPFNIVVKEISVSIIKQPKVISSINGMQINACAYISPVDVTTYWLFNETIKIPMDRVMVEGMEEEQPVSPLKISAYNMTGSYQCVVYDKRYMKEKVVSVLVTVPSQQEPRFLIQPKVEQKTNVVGSFLRFSTAEVSSYFPLKEVFILKNGVERINSLGFRSRLNRYTLTENLFQNERAVQYDDQGYYQFVVVVPGTTKWILSEKMTIQLNDTSNTKMTLKLDRTWNPQLADRSSQEFKSLEIELKEQIKSGLLKQLTDIGNKVIINILSVRPGSVEVDAVVTFTNLDNKMKLKLCNSIHKDINADLFTNLKVLSMQLKALDCCAKSSAGESLFKGAYTFEAKFATEISQQQCSYDKRVNVSRLCAPNFENGASWVEPDLGKCPPKSETTKNLIALSEVPVCGTVPTKNCKSFLNVAKQLNKTVINGSSITVYYDIKFITDTLHNIDQGFQMNNESSQALSEVLQTMNKLLDADADIIAKAQAVFSSSNMIQKLLNSIAFKLRFLASTGETIIFSEKNIAFTMEKTNKSDITIQSRVNKTAEVTVTQTANATSSTSELARIDIPSTAFANDSVIVYSYFYNKGAFFLTDSSLLKSIGRKTERDWILQTTVLAVTVGSEKVENLSSPVILTFKKVKGRDLMGTNWCVFWDEEKETAIKGTFGDWSTTDCWLYKPTYPEDDYVMCACDHLTNFGLLLDINQSGNNPLELKIITWIGCSISLAGLVLTVISFVMFRNLRKKLAPKLLIFLCVSLIGLLVTFLAGAEQTTPRAGCQAVAAILQYFMLATFCWMAVEAVNLYRCFVSVFKRGGESSFLKRACLFAFGLPAIIMLITAIAAPDQLGNDKICVVRGYPFFFGVLLPVCVILLVNFVVLGLVLRGINKSQLKTPEDHTAYEYYIGQARIAFSCAILLGLTWVFGILAVNELTDVFQWLFCITTAFQGFFIFIFYTVRNHDVRTEWLRLVGVNKSHTLTSSTGVPKSYELS